MGQPSYSSLSAFDSRLVVESSSVVRIFCRITKSYTTLEIVR